MSERSRTCVFHGEDIATISDFHCFCDIENIIMCICVSTDLTAVMCVVGYVSNMSLHRYGISKRAWPSNRPIPVSNSEISPLFNLGVLHCVLISWNLPFLQLNGCFKDKPLSVSSTCIFHVPKWIHCFFVITAHLVRTHFLKISISLLHSLQLNMSLEPSSLVFEWNAYIRNGDICIMTRLWIVCRLSSILEMRPDQ